MMLENTEFHIRKDDGPLYTKGTAHCGAGIGKYQFHFATINHAAENVWADAVHKPCPACWDVVKGEVFDGMFTGARDMSASLNRPAQGKAE